MSARNAFRAGALVALLGLAVACEPDAATAPVDNVQEVAAAVTLPTTGLDEAVWVCKDAPSGDFDFEVTGTIIRPFPMNIIEPAPTIAAGNCMLVANAGNGNLITVTELPEPGYLFDRIETFYVPMGTNTLIPGPIITGTPTVTRPYGDTGRLFIFYNVLEPPPPPTGCTLTQGYWKTHSEYGPAPYDDTWALLPAGADTPFYLSGQTWYQVFHTAPSGNAYYSLAHQFMAAVLNGLAGADPAAVQAELNAADILFSTYTPADIAGLKGSNPLRKQFVALAETLDDYNTGDIGPGHCPDD